ncbi:MAG: hypothetical protein E7047_02515 [Lentisphaerae bacterium]|nr:hypothetical protein [Lentisphaerota bacterium]
MKKQFTLIELLVVSSFNGKNRYLPIIHFFYCLSNNYNIKYLDYRIKCLPVQKAIIKIRRFGGSWVILPG